MNAAETGSETRWTSRWAGPIVWAVALSAQPSVALGQLQPELEARSHAGFDSNPGLAAVPGGRRDPSLEPELGPSGIAGLQGFVGAQYGGDLWIRGRLSLDGAWLTAGATRLEGRLGLEVGAEVDPFAISLGLLVGRYAASFGEDDASFGRAHLRGAWALSSSLLLGAQLDGELRRYDGGWQTDRSFGGGARLRLHLDRLLLGAGLHVNRRWSTASIAARLELAPFLRVVLQLSSYRLSLRYDLLGRIFDARARSGVEHIVVVEVRRAFLSWLGIFLRAEVGAASGESNALTYVRLYGGGGLVATLGGDLRPREPPEHAPRWLGRADGVRFRFHLPGASEVSVVGPFNRWDPRRGVLEPLGDGYFQGELPLAPGRHRYHLIVDGAPRRPPGSERYAPDGFGGQDAIFEIPPDPG